MAKQSKPKEAPPTKPSKDELRSWAALLYDIYTDKKQQDLQRAKE